MPRRAPVLALLALPLLLAGCVAAPTLDPGAAPGAPSAQPPVRCAAGDIVLDHPSTSYVLTGSCRRVSVEGADISVRATTIRELVLRGDRAHVIADAIGSLDLRGQDNAIATQSIGGLVIRGDRNGVDSDGDVARVSIEGNDNVVSALGAVGPTDDDGARNAVMPHS